MNTSNKHICAKCGKCCISINLRGVIIFPSDVKRISDGLNISAIDFINTYCVKGYIYKNIEVYFIKNTSVRCMFLNEKNLCSIHEFKPVQCKKAPISFFSKNEIWGNMPCLKNIRLDPEKSKESDYLLVQELIDGYHF